MGHLATSVTQNLQQTGKQSLLMKWYCFHTEDGLLLAQTMDNSNLHLYPSAKRYYKKEKYWPVFTVSGLESLILTCVTFQFYLLFMCAF